MSGFFGDILEVAKSILEMVDDINNAKKKRRKGIAELFEKTSVCLAGISSGMRKGNAPYGKCNKLLMCLEALGDKLDELENGIPIKVDGKIRSVREMDDVGKILKKIEKREDEESTLSVIEESCGKFQVLAGLVTMR